MPPVIYKGGRYAINNIQGRPYVVGSEGWLYSQFPNMQAALSSLSGILNVVMPAFSFEATTYWSNFEFKVDHFTFVSSQLSGTIGALSVNMPSFIATVDGKAIVFDASVYGVTSFGSCIQIPNISIESNSIEVTADGELTGSVTIVSPDPSESDSSSEKLQFSGEYYLVLNLRTGSHTTYRDGNNNAIAETGVLDLGGLETKNISDAYINSRVAGNINLATTIDEKKERVYPVTYNNTDEPSLQNKKVKLAKGLNGQNWKFAISVAEEDFSEIRSIDLLVHKNKRRV